MGNSSSNNTPVNSVPDRDFPPNFPRFPTGIEVAVSPDTRDHPFGNKRRMVTSVFRWENPGQVVYVTGDWDNFATKKQLVRTTSAHTLILEIPPGQHRYRFEVDGKWMADGDKPISYNVQGEQFNMMMAEEVSEFGSVKKTESTSPPGDYGQEIRDPPPSANRTKRKGNEPAMLPPHLLRALLNTQPATSVILPTPHVVMLNHLYVNRAREKDGVNIFGVTCRCRSKYVTTVLYKPV